MYEELGLLEELRIPREVLKKFLVRFGANCSYMGLEGDLTLSCVCDERGDFQHKQRLVNPPDFRALSPFELI